MKRQIRNSVFETNSSSTHSIAISKKKPVISKSIHFGIGEFDWENDCVDTADYLYTAILEQDERDEMLDKLIEILNKYSIEYEFETPIWHKSFDGEYEWLDNGHIDHSNETREFIFAVLDDEDLLMRCLFGDSTVYTGNDNQDPCPSGCNIADEEYYDWGTNKMIKNPYHDPENYDYFYKGN